MRLLALYKGRYYRLIIVRNKWLLTTYRKNKTDDTFTWREEEKVYIKEVQPYDSGIQDIREYHCEVHYEDEKFPLFRKLYQVDGVYKGPFQPDLEKDTVCINHRIPKEEKYSRKWVHIPEENVMIQMVNLNECKACYISSRTFYVKGQETYPPRTKYRKVSVDEFKKMLCEIMYT